jgi:predicted MFS family arabinose efflux permease
VTESPLRRNRDFVFFQIGQLLSDAGTSSTSIAYPLLVLALTHSAVKAGVVSFARTLPLALLALPAGLLADRWSRKRLMIGADSLRVVALGTLAVLILTHHVTFWTLPAVAFVEGCGTALFLACQAGVLRAVVPMQQLPTAVSTQTGREAVVQLSGQPLGGVLFAIARAVPFVVDAASYAFSVISLLAMRTPFQQPREPDDSSVRQRLAEGWHYLWGQPFLRTCALLFGITNFIIPGLVLAVVVLADRRGLSGGEVGGLLAIFGAALLIGSFLSPIVRRLLPVRGVMLLELWTYIDCVAFLIWPNVYVLVGCLVPTGLSIASTNSVVHGYRIAMTPDRLLGRAESVRSTISLLISPFGALTAGALLSVTSPRATVAVFLAVGAVLAGWGTLSPAIRAAPNLDDLLAKG